MEEQFGTTVLEQVPRRFHGAKAESRSPWALIIILIVVVLFGGFWLYERDVELSPAPTAPVAAPDTTTPATPAQPAPAPSVTDLQTATVNTAIPDFSDEF